MEEKIKIVIADDNKGVCDLLKNFLKNYKDIKILGIANTDEQEIEMIENLKPDIVITDLVRNHQYTGLDIIKEYYTKCIGPEFLVISSDIKKEVINDNLKVAGYIKKPFSDYELVYNELRRIKKEAPNSEFKKWLEKYHNDKVLKIRDFLNIVDIWRLKRLGLKIKNESYTAYELECLQMDLLMYYDDPTEQLSDEEKEMQKSLKETGITRNSYNKLLNKINKLIENKNTAGKI